VRGKEFATDIVNPEEIVRAILKDIKEKKHVIKL
jgi:hypothetical protein